VKVGVPTEIKKEEYRVALTPAGARELSSAGHEVLVQRGAGEGSSFDDSSFADAGAAIVDSAEEVFAAAELIVKVKEPQLNEIAMMRADQTLFTFLHIAAYPEMGAALVASGATGIAYETVALPSGGLPLLAPMSEIAGRMAAQAGAHHLERTHGGRGVLLGGVPGVAPARVTVLGAGKAGTNAAMIAAGMGAEVIVLDLNVEPLRHLEELHLGRVVTVRSSLFAVEQYVSTSDLVIGAVLIPGARAPVVVPEPVVAEMKPGSVIVDISIDQGGCIATAHETTHSDPIYVTHGVVHYAVGNIPGAVPNTSTHALTNATLPYVVALAGGVGNAVRAHPELGLGVNVAAGSVTHPAVGKFLGTPVADPLDVLGG